MNLIVGISFVLVTFFSSSSHAANAGQRTIEQVNVAEDGSGEAQLVIKISGGVASTSCPDKTAFIRPLNDEIGKQLMAVSLTAISTGALVDVLGTGSCGSWGVEKFK